MDMEGKTVNHLQTLLKPLRGAYGAISLLTGAPVLRSCYTCEWKSSRYRCIAFPSVFGSHQAVRWRFLAKDRSGLRILSFLRRSVTVPNAAQDFEWWSRGICYICLGIGISQLKLTWHLHATYELQGHCHLRMGLQWCYKNGCCLHCQKWLAVSGWRFTEAISGQKPVIISNISICVFHVVELALVLFSRCKAVYPYIVANKSLWQDPVAQVDVVT